jgi:hypothetical protein
MSSPLVSIGGEDIMIQIHINPARVERVVFLPGSALEEDFELAAWQTIRTLVDRIDEKLKSFAAEVACSRGEEK